MVGVSIKEAAAVDQLGARDAGLVGEEAAVQEGHFEVHGGQEGALHRRPGGPGRPQGTDGRHEELPAGMVDILLNFSQNYRT